MKTTNFKTFTLAFGFSALALTVSSPLAFSSETEPQVFKISIHVYMTKE